MHKTFDDLPHLQPKARAALALPDDERILHPRQSLVAPGTCQAALARFEELLTYPEATRVPCYLLTLLGTLQPALEALGPTLKSRVWHSVVDRIASYGAEEKDLAKAYLDELKVLCAIGTGHKRSLKDVVPRPQAQLKISPRL